MTADSEAALPDMKNLITRSQTPTNGMIFLKKVWTEISVIAEISTHLDSHHIIEYQIYRLVFCILQANLGQIMSKFSQTYVDVCHFTNSTDSLTLHFTCTVGKITKGDMKTVFVHEFTSFSQHVLTSYAPISVVLLET